MVFTYSSPTATTSATAVVPVNTVADQELTIKRSTGAIGLTVDKIKTANYIALGSALGAFGMGVLTSILSGTGKIGVAGALDTWEIVLWSIAGGLLLISVLASAYSAISYIPRARDLLRFNSNSTDALLLQNTSNAGRYSYSSIDDL